MNGNTRNLKVSRMTCIILLSCDSDSLYKILYSNKNILVIVSNTKNPFLFNNISFRAKQNRGAAFRDEDSLYSVALALQTWQMQ